MIQGRRLAFWSCLSVSCIVLLSGCGGGDSGPPRFHVSGMVNYKGAPIPKGTIAFEPDPDANNKGPSTLIPIENGTYSSKTAKVKGTVGGPMVVRINGGDGKEAGTLKNGTPLFKEYSEKVDLPKSETTKDFEVPAKK